MRTKQLLFSAITGFTLITLSTMSVSALAQPGLYAAWYAGYTDMDSHRFRVDSVTPIKTDLEGGYGVVGALGYDYGQFGGQFGARIEFELSYRDNAVDIHTPSGLSNGLNGSTGDATALAVMLNSFADYDTGTAFTPYLGVGLGMVNVAFEGYSTSPTGTVLNSDDDAFAYQFMAGGGYEVSDRVTLTADYRYFATEDLKLSSTAGFPTETSYDTHNLFFGMRFDLQ